MSLHRRITAAVTLAVACVCLTFGIIGYFSARGTLVGNVRHQLEQLASPYLRPHTPGQGGGTPPPGASAGQGGSPSAGQGAGQGSGQGGNLGNPTSCAGQQRVVDQDDQPYQKLGGAKGNFQSVCPDGRVIPINGGTRLPVTKRVLAVARTLTGAYFFTAEVEHTPVEIYVAPDRPDHKAVECDLPLSAVDSTLHGLLLTYALLVACGAALAGLIGALIARSALAPIRRFTRATEQVTSSLDRPRRLEETGTSEISRLAASFNQTLTALERSVEAQRQLIADASHELRTPIAALRSNIQIFLEADQLPRHEQEELRDAIVAELDDLTQLVADVLELARGSSPSEHVEELELDTIVAEAIERARRRSPQLSFDAQLEPTVITNLPDRVSRAVSNVIDNARRWSPDGARVEVTLRDGLLTVRDHGPGFREEDLAHVFERFYRSADARRMPGSGLGLAIVQQAAQAHGGSASVANAPDGGAIVRITFGPEPTPTAATPRPPGKVSAAPYP